MRTNRSWRPAAFAAATLFAATVVAAPASAHEGNPKYRSEIRTVTPAVEGVTVRVLDHDDALELTNRSDQTVVVYGYEHEPYIRFLADGTVQINDHSATAQAAEAEEAAEEHEHDEAAAGYVLASYDVAHAGEDHSADEEHSAEEEHPASEPGDDHGTDAAAIQWTTLDQTGRYSWHDDRIKYRESPVPPQVTDESQETKVLDWNVPIRVGTQAGAIDGTLFWVGEPGSDDGFPVAAAVSLALLALLAAAAVMLVRRRRAAGDGTAGA